MLWYSADSTVSGFMEAADVLVVISTRTSKKRRTVERALVAENGIPWTSCRTSLTRNQPSHGRESAPSRGRMPASSEPSCISGSATPMRPS